MAVLKWPVVLERAWAAPWQWYKFYGYGGGGHIVVGTTTQTIFLVGSSVVAAAGYLLERVEAHTAGSKICRAIARIAWSSIVVCTFFWVAFLVSPLVTFWVG